MKKNLFLLIILALSTTLIACSESFEAKRLKKEQEEIARYKERVEQTDRLRKKLKEAVTPPVFTDKQYNNILRWYQPIQRLQSEFESELPDFTNMQFEFEISSLETYKENDNWYYQFDVHTTGTYDEIITHFPFFTEKRDFHEPLGTVVFRLDVHKGSKYLVDGYLINKF